jgi:uncharacterized protein with HEPN domain
MSSERKALPARVIVRRARGQIARIVQWTAHLDADAYAGEELRRYAVERAFIALGEAIKDLARVVDLATLDPAGPWRESARFRDFLAHDYDDQVIPDVVWATIHHGIPELDEALARLESRV